MHNRLYNASRTMLLNVHTLEWDDGCDMLRIPRTILPELKSSSGMMAETSPLTFFGGRFQLPESQETNICHVWANLLKKGWPKIPMGLPWR